MYEYHTMHIESLNLSNGLKWNDLILIRQNTFVDLKPQNLLLTHRNQDGETSLPMLKIADFGFARHLEIAGMAETLCGSPLYMAPEILKFQKYDTSADLWSVGCIVFEMVAHRPPFGGANHIQLLTNIERNELRFPEHVQVSPACIGLLQGLLRRHPHDRLSYAEFFAHSFVNVDPVEAGKLSTTTTSASRSTSRPMNIPTFTKDDTAAAAVAVAVVVHDDDPLEHRTPQFRHPQSAPSPERNNFQHRETTRPQEREPVPARTNQGNHRVKSYSRSNNTHVPSSGHRRPVHHQTTMSSEKVQPWNNVTTLQSAPVSRSSSPFPLHKPPRSSSRGVLTEDHRSLGTEEPTYVLVEQQHTEDTNPHHARTQSDALGCTIHLPERFQDADEARVYIQEMETRARVLVQLGDSRLKKDTGERSSPQPSLFMDHSQTLSCHHPSSTFDDHLDFGSNSSSLLSSNHSSSLMEEEESSSSNNHNKTLRNQQSFHCYLTALSFLKAAMMTSQALVQHQTRSRSMMRMSKTSTNVVFIEETENQHLSDLIRVFRSTLDEKLTKLRTTLTSTMEIGTTVLLPLLYTQAIACAQKAAVQEVLGVSVQSLELYRQAQVLLESLELILRSNTHEQSQGRPTMVLIHRYMRDIQHRVQVVEGKHQ